GPHLSVLLGATAAHVSTDPDLGVIEKMLGLARSMFPHVVLDLPNGWTPLVRNALLSADNIVLVAEPDLANLRNARSLLDFLKQVRPNDPPPRLILNRVGVPKRKEIKPDAFAAALQIDLSARIGFDPALFSEAAANGQVFAEVSPKAAVSPFLAHLAEQLTGRPQPHQRSGLGRFWGRS
ncbi:MAG: CtpF protein, partial [Candidatus Saccharibacteria bacterium]|nr:CtpF protein [Pseudorhodobacter sp.]